MDQFFIFLESTQMTLNQVIPFVDGIIKNIEDTTSLLVFADFLDETYEPDYVQAAKGIRKMLSTSPYSDEKKEHYDLLQYSNDLRIKVYDFFKNLDYSAAPVINSESGRLMWHQDRNTVYQINTYDPSNIQITIYDGSNFVKLSLNELFKKNRNFDPIIAKFLVLMVMEREANSWINRRHNEEIPRMAGFSLHNLRKEIYNLLHIGSFRELNTEELRKVSKLFADTKNKGADQKSLSDAADFLMNVIHQLEIEYQGVIGFTADRFYDLAREYGGHNE